MTWDTELYLNGTKNSDKDSITQTHHIVWCHTKLKRNPFPMTASLRHSRLFSLGMLEGRCIFRALLYSVLTISALGMDMFWRWIVRSDTDCLGLCDILEAKGEQRITNVPTACITQWHADSPLISLFKWSLILLVPIYTSTDPYLDFTQPNNSYLTGKGRPVKDKKNTHNDKTEWNQVLLTCCDVSRNR